MAEQPLEGKVAIVTGGGRGVGRGIALALAVHGAKVVVNDLGGSVDGAGASSGPASEVVEEIHKRGGEAVANFDDVSLMANAEKLVKQAVDKWGKLDAIVTCAGILRDRMVFNMTEEEWDAVIAVHLKGTFACVKYASILMRQQRSGSIVTITSTSGLYGNPGQANYSSAKSGIVGLTKVAARDLGRYGVRVNSVAPAAATRMTMTPEVMKAREMRAQMGIKREGFGDWGEPPLEKLDPEDVAPTVVFLVSDNAANVNGQVFYAAGGTISLVSQPRPIKTIYKDGLWTLDELDGIMPFTLAAGLVNPAQPQQAPPQPAPAKR
ncbi:MAG: SDR family oxidoreductase [Chloroflexi bacterium]|nr:SDR family oxidoreductase [Chloroflexota bacterium]